MKQIIFFVMLILWGSSSLMSCKKSSGGSDTPTDTTVVTETLEYIDTLPPATPMVHPGGLQVAEDFTRIKAALAGNKEPWLSGWNKLIANSHAQLSYVASPTVKLIRGGNSREEPEPDNYSRAFNDVAAAYQTGLRWKISGDTTYAEKSIQILNAWAGTCTTLSGDPNIALAAGIYGYQFAITGELMRDYKGWKAADFSKYQQWMLNVFYSYNHAFLLNHQNSCPDLFWANWDLCNLASVMAIGILADKRSIYNEAVNYFQRGVGNGNIRKAINYVWKDQGLAQLQESGRDQGHATLVISLLGTICEMSYHQNDDFYGYNSNRFLKASEYTAKYNVANLSVPFQPYTYYNCSTTTNLTQISSDGRGTVRPMWAMIYNHYVKRKGLTAQYTLMGVQTTQPEGGGGDYGPNSGGFDQMGFGTLLYTR